MLKMECGKQWYDYTDILAGAWYGSSKCLSFLLTLGRMLKGSLVMVAFLNTWKLKLSNSMTFVMGLNRNSISFQDIKVSFTEVH